MDLIIFPQLISMKRPQPQQVAFTDEIVQMIFGNEAAEDETFDRLQSYYLKGETHEKVIADLPLRIVVGHKGIGKSAIFAIARNEDIQKSRLAILIKPDDIADLGKSTQDPLQTIRDWKTGLNRIIAAKALESLGLLDETELLSSTLNFTGKLLSFLTATFNNKIAANVNIDPTQRKIIDKFLRHSKIVIYIDDLDRGWQSRKEDINRISALLIAVRDMSSETPGLNFKISLRSDVYYLVRTSDESTDKIESSVIWHKWTNQEILILLIKRIETFFERDVNIDILRKTKSKHLAHHLDSIFEARFNSSGKWADIPTYQMLMSLIRQRPRDLVKLCTLAARNAYSKNDSIISTLHFKSIFEEYSQGRMQDTINEYKSELPSIDRLLFGMKPNGRQVKHGKWFVYDTNELRSKLNNIIEQGTFVFANGKVATHSELSQFLYKINFITARKIVKTEDGEEEIDRKYFEENRYLSSKFVDFGYDWEVHPAFRWVLQPSNIQDLLSDIGKYKDE